MISSEQLYKIYGTGTRKRCEIFAPFLDADMQLYHIDSPLRISAFIAQIGHESGRLLYTEEIASGKDYDTGRKARSLGNTPEADGDGQRYKGRGLIMITGRDNYKAVSKALGIDFIAYPELLSRPECASQSACWWWQSHGLNALADRADFKAITKKINGGMNGYSQRCAFYIKAKKIFNYETEK